MIDIKISDNLVTQWRTLLDSFGSVLGIEFFIYKDSGQSEKHTIISPTSSAHFEHPNHVINDDIHLLITNIVENGRPTQEHIVINDQFISGLPIKWSNDEPFGVLLMFSQSGDVLPSHLCLIQSLVTHLERDLNQLFAENHASQTPDFQSFINSFTDHIWIKDKNGVYTHGNTQIEKAWGRSLSNIIGKTDSDLFDEETAAKFLMADEQALELGKQLVVEECFEHRSADVPAWLETIKAPLLGKNGEYVGIIGMTRNVSNRKAIEDQLMLASAVFENSLEGVTITSSEGAIIYVNPAFGEITGYPLSDVIGKNPRILQSGLHDNFFYKDMWDSLSTRGKWKGEIWNRKKNGELFPILSTISAVYDDNEEICNYVAVFSDISQQKKQESDLLHMAYHDPLTDLPNRTKLTEQIEREILYAQGTDRFFATICIDIDHFKHINDSYGHVVGDEILCELAKRFTEKVREEDMVARIGGDEFVILLPSLKNFDSISVVIQKLTSVFEKPIMLPQSHYVRITSSMGIAIYPNDGESSEFLLSHADAAMYRAKQSGRNNYAYYTQALTKESKMHVRIQGAMHEALEKGGFSLVYQPQVDMVTGKLVGVETLIRWNDPKLGNVPPSEFIPIAEKMGLIKKIGVWVLKTACKQAVEWRDNGYSFGRIAVNVSGMQLQSNDFVKQVKHVLNETGLEAKYLELEVTEGFMMNNSENSIEYLNALRALGVELAMDDFGTGYSSLSYLQKLPLNKIKIDKSFVSNLPNNAHDVAIADAIIALTNALSLRVIAEGVETQEQADFLVQRGCEQAQGFYFSKPLSAHALISVFKERG